MNLHYDGREEIPVPLDIVWSFITDPASIASCMPQVVGSTVHDPQHFDATVQVAVGPVKGKFTFKVALDPSPDRTHMGMKISGGGLGSVVDLIAQADITSESSAATVLDWQGTATMRGPVATVGGRVIDAQARTVITTTFANIKERLTATAV